MNVEPRRRVDLAEAKAHLGELVSSVEEGETVDITKLSKPVATVSPPMPPIDRAALQRVTDSMPYGEGEGEGDAEQAADGGQVRVPPATRGPKS